MDSTKNNPKRLTTPFWTENPNWYFVSGLFILTSTTGAQDTAVNFTAVLFLVFWKLHKKHTKLDILFNVISVITAEHFEPKRYKNFGRIFEGFFKFPQAHTSIWKKNHPKIDQKSQNFSVLQRARICQYICPPLIQNAQYYRLKINRYYDELTLI